MLAMSRHETPTSTARGGRGLVYVLAKNVSVIPQRASANVVRLLLLKCGIRAIALPVPATRRQAVVQRREYRKLVKDARSRPPNIGASPAPPATNYARISTRSTSSPAARTLAVAERMASSSDSALRSKAM